MDQDGDPPSPVTLEDEGFILLTELRPIVPLHPQHIRKLARRGQFPKPVKIGGRTAFRRRDIRDWARRQV
jgi:predicted DNA-binding transcriptional regulator AlpA